MKPRKPLARSTTPIARKARVKRGKPPQRRGRVRTKRVSPRRQANRDPQFLAWIREQPCALLGEHIVAGTPDAIAGRGIYVPRTEACHVRTKRLGGDVANIVPLCHTHHEEQHRNGIQTFQARHKIDLAASAKRYWEHYCENHWGIR